MMPRPARTDVQPSSPRPAAAGSRAGRSSAGRRSPAAARGPCSKAVANNRQAELFKALADPNRIALLARLADCGRPCTVSEIACCLTVDLSVVSRHLRQLREAGILHAERHGKEVRYQVRYDELVRTLRAMADAIESCCPAGTGAQQGDQSTMCSSQSKPGKRRR